MQTVRIRYSLAIADFASKHFELRLTLTELSGEHVQLRLPSWIPGSYLMREYAGHVASVHAAADGRALPVEKSDKSTWDVSLEGAVECEVRYRVYAPELSVRTSDITHDHAFVNPASVFFAVVGRENEPYEVEVNAPADWRVHSHLPADDATGSFVAQDFDQLIDSPFELGPFDAHSFDVNGVPHELVVAGDGNLDLPRALDDMAKICAYEHELFGDMPSERYQFLLLLTAEGGGGLEHCDGSVLAWPKLRFRPEKDYRKFLTLVAHEYFHLWNVKRIKPEAFTRFDYNHEMHTRLLWVFEGITSYYDQLVPLRAGVFEAKHYFELLTERIVAERSRGGRHIQSIADSSYDTWIKLYRQTPDSYNTQVSYYERGELVALLLDLHLRASTGDERSLDDVLRHMYSDYYKAGKGVPEDGFASIVETATGVDCREFLALHVDGVGDLSYDSALASVGIQLVEDIKPDAQDEAWLGAAINVKSGRSILGNVATLGPAYEGGLMSGDEIIALDGHRVGAELASRVKLYSHGEAVSWTAFRHERIVEGRVEFTRNPNPPLKMVGIESASDAQRESYERWTDCAWAAELNGSDS